MTLETQALALVNKPEEIQAGAAEIQVRAEQFEILDQEDYELAAENLRPVKTRQKAIQAESKDPKSAANKAHKSISALEKKCLAPALAAEVTYKGKMADWNREQRRIEAERVAEESRVAEEQRLAEAEALAEAGHEEAADRILEAPVPAMRTAPKPKTAGISETEVWSAEVVNYDQFLGGIIEGVTPRGAVSIDQGLLNRQASALQNALNYPGVKVSSKMRINAR